LCVVANKGFAHTLGTYANQCLFSYSDARQLAERLKWALTLSDNERARIGHFFREQVLADHSLDGLTQKLLKIFGTVMAPKQAVSKTPQTLVSKVRK
jgi:hypothetical protein